MKRVFGAPGALFPPPIFQFVFSRYFVSDGDYFSPLIVFVDAPLFCSDSAPVVYRFPSSTFASTILHDWVSGVEDGATA